jgi:hypothetical protein
MLSLDDDEVEIARIALMCLGDQVDSLKRTRPMLAPETAYDYVARKAAELMGRIKQYQQDKAEEKADGR